MNIDIDNKEQLEKWKQDAEGSSFYGIVLKDLDRDGLLAVIGYLNEEGRKFEKLYCSHDKI